MAHWLIYNVVLFYIHSSKIMNTNVTLWHIDSYIMVIVVTNKDILVVLFYIHSSKIMNTNVTLWHIDSYIMVIVVTKKDILVVLFYIHSSNYEYECDFMAHWLIYNGHCGDKEGYFSSSLLYSHL